MPVCATGQQAWWRILDNPELAEACIEVFQFVPLRAGKALGVVADTPLVHAGVIPLKFKLKVGCSGAH